MISIIAAVSKNNLIGKNGKIPWAIKEDMQHFKKITTGNILIMGRRSFEEINHSLPNRFVIIISTTKQFNFENCKVVSDFSSALEFANEIADREGDFHNKDIFICGGSQVYRSGMPFVKKLYLTKIEKDFDGDVFFPEYDDKQFKLVSEEKHHIEDFDYSFLELERI